MTNAKHGFSAIDGMRGICGLTALNRAPSMRIPEAVVRRRETIMRDAPNDAVMKEA